MATLVWIVFWGARDTAFITLDDPQAVTQNSHILSGLTAEGVQWAFRNISEFYWQPLTWISHMLVVENHGLDPAAHHWVNVGLHSLAVMLLFLALRSLTGARWRSAFVTALFAIHPLRVESVVWVTERNDVLCGVFFMATLWAYSLWQRHRGIGRYLLWNGLAALALMSKPVAVTLPVVLLILDLWPLQRLLRLADLKRALVEKIPVALMALAVVGLTAASMWTAADRSLSFSDLPLYLRVSNLIWAVTMYLRKLVWPAGLGVFYPYRLHGTWGMTLPAVAIGLISMAASRQWRRAPYLLAGWLWFLCMLLPVSGLMQAGGQSMADRFTYLPMIGVAIALVWGAAELAGIWGRKAIVASAAAGLIALCGYGWAASRQIQYWHDSFTLYRHTLNVTSLNEAILRKISEEAQRLGRTDEAIEFYRQAVKAEPARLLNYRDLGRLLTSGRRYSEAIAVFREALRRQPEYVPLRKELAFAYYYSGYLDEAAKEFREVLHYEPGDTDARMLLDALGRGEAPANSAVPAQRARNEQEFVESIIAPADEVQRPGLLEETYWQFLLVILCLILACSRPDWMARLAPLERRFTSLAAHRRLALLIVLLLPLGLRLLLLPWHPVPLPRVADEFGHLLLADTFASGRLTNPRPPSPEHFDSIYVLCSPSYTSIYPMAQGLALALPKMLGLTPWFGVWLSTGLMCMAVCWMLQAWLPPRWAFYGGLIAALRLGVVSHWMDSYWGGSVAALGGALLLGALARLVRDLRAAGPRPLDALLFGLGLGLLGQTRPYEGLVLALPVVLYLLWELWRSPLSGTLKATRLALPLGLVILALAGFFALYNHRVTGDWRKLPYLLYRERYGVPQNFYFQAPVPQTPDAARHRDLLDNYLWQRLAHERVHTLSQYAEATAAKLQSFWSFFVQPLFTLPLLMLPWMWHDRRLRLPLVLICMVLVAVSWYPFYFPHYTAPLTAMVVLLLVAGLRRLRALRWTSPTARWSFAGLPLARGLAFSLFLLVLVPTGSDIALPVRFQRQSARTRVLEALAQEPGRHLVLVRYRPDHLFHRGWVYNDADLEASPVVWARELDELSNRTLAHAFSGRKIWLFEPDERPARLTVYPVPLFP